jgi:hypothetical protein
MFETQGLKGPSKVTLTPPRRPPPAPSAHIREEEPDSDDDEEEGGGGGWRVRMHAHTRAHSRAPRAF